MAIDPLDKILAELAEEYGSAQPKKPEVPQAPLSQFPGDVPNSPREIPPWLVSSLANPKADPLSHLLEELKDSYGNDSTSSGLPSGPPPSPPPLEQLKVDPLLHLLEDFKRIYKDNSTGQPVNLPQPSPLPRPEHKLSTECPSVQVERDHPRASVRQQPNWEQRARQWLNRLDPESFDGEWFDLFARPYPSRLEAAIAMFEGLAKIDEQHPS